MNETKKRLDNRDIEPLMTLIIDVAAAMCKTDQDLLLIESVVNTNNIMRLIVPKVAHKKEFFFPTKSLNLMKF